MLAAGLDGMSVGGIFSWMFESRFCARVAQNGTIFKGQLNSLCWSMVNFLNRFDDVYFLDPIK